MRTRCNYVPIISILIGAGILVTLMFPPAWLVVLLALALIVTGVLTLCR